jgi:integrase
MSGKNHPQSFGKPISMCEMYSLFTNAIAKATTALYGKPRWANPHSLRHVAAKHVRMLEGGDVESLAEFMGHTKRQGDEYAAQIMNTVDRLSNFSDSWWE